MAPGTQKEPAGYGPPATGPAGNGLTRLLLDDIAAVLAKKDVQAKDKVSSAALVAALVALAGRPWAAVGKARKPLTADGMASLLRPLGIAPRVLKIGGKAHRGYRASAFGPVTKERQAMAEDEVTPQKAAPTEEHVPRRLTADGLEVVGPAPGQACTQCGSRDGEVLLVRDVYGIVPPQPLHDACGGDWCVTRTRELAEARRRGPPQGQ